MICDLPSLLQPAGEEKFLEHFIEKKRLHVRASDPQRAASLLPWTTVNHLIECDVLPPDRMRVIRANIDVATLMYRRRDEHRHLRAGALQQLLAQGASVIINDVSDLVPEIGRLSDNIERRLAHRVGVNAYLSFGRGSAFKAHFDYHDVIVLQIHGRKRWRSLGTPFPFPVEQPGGEPSKEAPTETVWEDVLEPGDVLYLPRGEVHEAAVEGPRSVHLTIGVHVRHGIHFLEWLGKRAALDPQLRMDLTRVAGEEALRRHEALLKQRLHALIDGSSVEQFLDAEDIERRPRVLLNIGLDDLPDDDTLILPAPRRHLSHSADGDPERPITIGDERYSLSTPARQALSLLLANNGLTFNELRGALAAQMNLDLLREAVRELARNGLVGLNSVKSL
ncbi:MAG TPA: cupin domain-containing protein [Stellaceae bacterium]|nr:cupin domain-containing protein [Stellaceae bacterium]